MTPSNEFSKGPVTKRYSTLKLILKKKNQDLIQLTYFLMKYRVYIQKIAQIPSVHWDELSQYEYTQETNIQPKIQTFVQQHACEIPYCTSSVLTPV